MKRFIGLASIFLLLISFTSCGSVDQISSQKNEVAGYTLKNKKELMEQKILHNKSKTAIATP